MAAVGLTIVLLMRAAAPGLDELVLAFACIGFMAAACLRPFPLSFRRKLVLDTSVVVAAILLFRPGTAMLIAGAGVLLASAIRRGDPVEAAFNAAQTMLQAAAAGLVLAAGDGEVNRVVLDGPKVAAVTVVAGMAIFVVGNAAVATAVALQAGMPLLRVWYQTATNVSREELAGHLVQVGLGVVAAVLVSAAPWTLPLLLLPAIVVSALLGRGMELRWQAEAALRDRDESLAEAQRIARLGSWEWDLTTGYQVWSDEAYRILGFAPQTFVPTYGTLLLAVHPADRADVDDAIQEALYEGGRFQIDHRIRLHDGAERLVHQQGEVRCDDAGLKIRVTGTIQDVTERKALEAQVEHIAERQRTASELAEVRRRLAATNEAERLRLARDLHDGPVQDLLVVSYQLADHRRSLGPEPAEPDLGVSLDTARQEVLEVVSQLRGVIGELRPAGLAEFGLPAALEGYVARLRREGGDHVPAIELDIDPQAADLPQPLALALFRVAQEALRNVVRHSKARQATVAVRRRFGDVWLEIRDDGCGFRTPARLSELAHAGHFGLVGLAERVDQAEGELTVASMPGLGTTVSVRVPVVAVRGGP